MSLDNVRLKKSNFCFLFNDKKNNFAIFHSLSCKVIYGKKIIKDIFNHFLDYNTCKSFIQRSDPDKNRRLLHFLYNEGLIVKDDSKDNEIFNNLKNQVRKKIFLKTLYLSLTYKCNFNCSYCLSNNSIALQRDRNLDMNKDIAKMAADFYLNNIKEKGDKEVVFYGGEPLLNFRVLKFLVNYINKKEKLKLLNKDYKLSRFILCTNGSLIDKEKAKFIKGHNIYPTVTFDGDELIHNSVRKYKNGRGTYSNVLSGYKLLQRLNFPVGVTLTLGSHNVSKLKEFVELFAEKLKPYTMATNIVVDYEGGGNRYICDGNVLADNLIKAFRVARKKGVYLVKYLMDNRVKPFVEMMPRLKGCTGTGSRAMVLPDGTLAACAVFVNNSKVNLQNNPKVKDYIPEGIEYYSPFFKNQCKSCFAISCCGGGCPKCAEVRHGTFWALDDDYCVQSKKILEWLIWDLFSFLDKKRLTREKFLYPTMTDRRKVYGKIRVFKSPLDFQYTPNINK
jgi:uncharacterized protein